MLGVVEAGHKKGFFNNIEHGTSLLKHADENAIDDKPVAEIDTGDG